MRIETIGDATLYCADCRDVLPALSSVDAVVTDPPYGVNCKYEGHDDSAEGYEIFCAGWFDLCHERAATILLTPGTKNVAMWSRIRPYKWILAWLKPGAMGNSPVGVCNWEPVLMWGKGTRDKTDVFSAPIIPTKETGSHPCPKPVAWAEQAIQRTPAQTILDPFMGSGTTGVACARLGRKFIGIEIHEPYFDIACRRIEEAQKQSDLFIHTKPEAKPHTPDMFGEP